MLIFWVIVLIRSEELFPVQMLLQNTGRKKKYF